MLVLTRRFGESVLIRTPEGREIKVLVVPGGGKRSVRLAFEAERSVVIEREELLAKKEADDGDEETKRGHRVA